MSLPERGLGELDPQVEIENYAQESVVRLAQAMASDRQYAMQEWGVNFYFGMLSRLEKAGSFFEGKFELDKLQNQLSNKARKIDEGKDDLHPSVWKVDSKGGRAHLRVTNQLDISWAGLLGELATLEVLWKLNLRHDGTVNLGSVTTLIHGGDRKMLADFDREGSADFIIMKVGTKKELIGVQVKIHRGSGVALFDGSDEVSAAALKKEVKNLKDRGRLNTNTSLDYGQENFATMTRAYLGRDYRPRLLYLLVGMKEIDRTNGLFYPGIRQAVSESLKQMIEGDPAAVRIGIDGKKKNA